MSADASSISSTVLSKNNYQKMIISWIGGIIPLSGSRQFLSLFHRDLYISKIAHFIGVYHLSIQNGQNGQANGQVFICMLPPLSLTLYA